VHGACMHAAGRITRCREYDSHGEKSSADAAEEFTEHSFLLTDGDRTGWTFPHKDLRPLLDMDVPITTSLPRH
jgi:hypothetical protein